MRSAKPEIRPSTEPRRERQPQRVAADERRGNRCAREHPRGEVDADGPQAGLAELATQVAGAARDIEHDRTGSRARARGTAVAAPADVHAERQQAVEQVVARRDPVEHVFDDLRLVGRCRQRRVRVGLHERNPSSSRPGRGFGDCRELGVLTDALEVLLRDREQHAAEVVGDERGDRGEQHAERGDELLGLLVVGEIGRAQRLPHVLVEQRHRLLGDVSRRRGVFACEREELGQRQAAFEQRQTLLHDRDVGSRVALRAVVDARQEQAFARDRFEEGERDARRVPRARAA